MAKLDKSNIETGQTIQASDITDIYDALGGTGATDVMISGSLSAMNGIVLSGHIIPQSACAFDVGSSSFPIRDLHMSGSTLYMYGESGTAETFSKADISKLRKGRSLKVSSGVSKPGDIEATEIELYTQVTPLWYKPKITLARNKISITHNGLELFKTVEGNGSGAHVALGSDDTLVVLTGSDVSRTGLASHLGGHVLIRGDLTATKTSTFNLVNVTGGLTAAEITSLESATASNKALIDSLEAATATLSSNNSGINSLESATGELTASIESLKSATAGIVGGTISGTYRSGSFSAGTIFSNNGNSIIYVNDNMDFNNNKIYDINSLTAGSLSSTSVRIGYGLSNLITLHSGGLTAGTISATTMQPYNLNASNSITASNDLVVGDNATIGDDLTVNGNATVTGTVTVGHAQGYGTLTAGTVCATSLYFTDPSGYTPKNARDAWASNSASIDSLESATAGIVDGTISGRIDAPLLSAAAIYASSYGGLGGKINSFADRDYGNKKLYDVHSLTAGTLSSTTVRTTNLTANAFRTTASNFTGIAAAQFDSHLTAGGSSAHHMKVNASYVTFANLPATDPGVAGRLYKRTGSQLGMTGSAHCLSSTFVMISAG